MSSSEDGSSPSMGEYDMNVPDLPAGGFGVGKSPLHPMFPSEDAQAMLVELREKNRQVRDQPGKKFDGGEDKLRWDLVPPGPLKEVVKVFTGGCHKYGPRNWEKGMSWSRCYAALMRHLQVWWGEGEQRDPETGGHHLAMVAWYCLVLIEFESTHPSFDDRPLTAPRSKSDDDRQDSSDE